MERNSRALKIFLTVLAALSVVLSCIFAFLNNVPVGFDGNSTTVAAPSIYINTAEYVGVKYPQAITPPDWVFTIIWPTIFLWNIIGAAYMVAGLFLKKDASPTLREPALVPIPSLIFWSLSWICSLSWLFASDREIMGLALFLIMMACWTTYAALAFSYRSYISDGLIMEEYSKKMLILVRVLIHNGYAIYATWLTVGWKLSLAVVITYVDSRGLDEAKLIGTLTVEDGGTVVLSLLLFEIILWFILENFVFEKYCRYTLSIYPTLIFAFSGIFTAGYDDPYSRNHVITLVGLILVAIAFPARVALVLYRHRNRIRFA